MKYYLIYQIRNKLNGMIYIGQHQTENLNDGYMGSGLRIQHAIKKYGIDNFEKTILFECASEEEMNKKEAEIVNEDFIARDDVYNITLGGQGGWHHTHSCGAKKGGINAMRKNKERGVTPFTIFYYALTENERLQYIKNHPVSKNFRCDWSGRHHSEESKQKMKAFRKLYHPGAGEKNSQYGTMWISNADLKESKKIHKGDEIPKGWFKGKVQNWEIYKLKQMGISNPSFYFKKFNSKTADETYSFILKENQKLEEKKNEMIHLYKMYYEEYKKNGFKAVVEKFGYKYSRINFLNMCKKYVLGL